MLENITDAGLVACTTIATGGIGTTIALLRYLAHRNGNGGSPCGKYSGVVTDINNLKETDKVLFERIDGNHREIMDEIKEMRKDIVELKVNTARK